MNPKRIIDSILTGPKVNGAFVLGYYGGGNYGDELLLEVLLHRIMSVNRSASLKVLYLHRVEFKLYHHVHNKVDVCPASPLSMLRAVVFSKSVIIGGGGLWGMDANKNILLMSILLVFAKLIRKPVYLLGVGYYGSTNRLGHVAARIAAFSAKQIIVRDKESQINFARWGAKVAVDSDIAFLASRVDRSEYAVQVKQIEQHTRLARKNVYITLRQFRGKLADRYVDLVEQLIKKHPNQNFLISLMQTRTEYSDGSKILRRLSAKYSNVSILDTEQNPLGILFFFEKHAEKFIFITPQFHAIVTAMVCGIPFLPLAYDNKVTELLTSQQISPIRFKDLAFDNMNGFIGTHHK